MKWIVNDWRLCYNVDAKMGFNMQKIYEENYKECAENIIIW